MEPEALRRFARELAEAGLDGLEAIYPLNTPKDAAFLKDLAGELGLLVSGGSDFHGANKPDIRLGTGRGNLAVPDAVLAGLKARLQVF